MDPSSQTPRAGFWSAVREGILGTRQDFTTGSLPRAITLLAIPMVLEMLMESLFGIVNVFWVARLGVEAVAVVGITEALLVLVFGIALGLAMATTAVVARRIGEKDHEAASVAAVQSITLGILVAALVGVAGVLFAPALLRLMAESPGIVRAGRLYTSIILGGSVSVMLLFLINAVFRGAGDAVFAMRALWFGNLINIVLDPCLIFGLGPFPELGLNGAAIANTIGRSAGVAFQLAVLFGGRGRVVVAARHLRIVPAVMWRIVRVSLTGIFQYLVATASWLALMRFMSTFGPVAIAGYTIAVRIIVVTLLPSWGMSNATATLVGQNLGAGKPDRAERAVWLSGIYNMVFLGGVAVAFIFSSERLVRIFTDDPAVVLISGTCLRVVAYGYGFYAFGMVVLQAFNGAGDTVTPTIISLFCYWMWQLPLAWVLGRSAGFGPTGIFWAIAIAQSTLAIVGMLTFRRGRWKLKRV